MRAGSYNAHMSQQDIDELGHFIQAGIAKESSYAGHPWIVRGGSDGIGIVIDIHGPELVAPEGLAQETNPFLFEEYGAFRIQLNQHAQYRKQPWKNEEDNGQ